VTLRARWVTLRARWVTLRTRWVTLRTRWVTLRARWVTLRARWVTLTSRWVSLRCPARSLRCVSWACASPSPPRAGSRACPCPWSPPTWRSTSRPARSTAARATSTRRASSRTRTFTCSPRSPRASYAPHAPSPVSRWQQELGSTHTKPWFTHHWFARIRYHPNFAHVIIRVTPCRRHGLAPPLSTSRSTS
jgi:hypothetical protein